MLIGWLATYFYQRFNWLSLDVVMGAMLCHRLAIKLPHQGVTKNWQSTVVLGLVTWVVYLLDRRFDNAFGSSTARHRFHKKHQVILQKIALGAVALAAVLCFWLPASVLKVGVYLAILVSFYLFLVFRYGNQRWFEPLKDLFVPLGYTVGVWGTALALQEEIPSEAVWLGVAFWAIAQQNLLLNAYFESFLVDEGNSLAILWGETITRMVLTLLLVLVIGAGGYVVFVSTQHYTIRVALWLVAMGLWQHWLWQKPSAWLPEDRYRLMAEATFLIPLFAI